MRKCWILKLDSYSTRLDTCLICRASKFFLIAISTPPRHLVDQSSKFLSPRHLIDSCICRSLKLDICYLSRFKKETKILICFLEIRQCVIGTSFLLILDIYKVYFRGCYIREYKGDIWKRWLMPYFLWKKLLRLCVLGFCNQMLLDLHCRWSEELCSQQSSQVSD